MLSSEQIAARRGKITASRVAPLMTGDAEKIMQLYFEMTDDPRFSPPDLSGVWPVQLGSETERLNLRWFERKHGPVTRQGEVVIGPIVWMACTLDGWSEMHSAVIECKHVGGREPLQKILDRYQPQLQWQMQCCHCDLAALSVIEGANAPVIEWIPAAPDYQAEMVKRAGAFMACVQSRTPPMAVAPVAPPTIPSRVYDMTGSNSWAADAVKWIDTYRAASDFRASEIALKAATPQDAVRATGHGIEIKRNRAGSLTIREVLTDDE